MSSGKKRRVHSESAVAVSLDRSMWVRLSLYLMFCVAASLLAMRGAGGTRYEPEPLLASLYSFFLALASVTIFELNFSRRVQANGRVVLVLSSVIGQLALMEGLIELSRANQLPASLRFMLMPFPLTPMLVSVLLGRGVGTFATLATALLGSLLVPPGEEVIFLAISLISGLVVVQTLHRTRKRAQLLRAGVYGGIATLLLGIFMGVVDVRACLQDSSMLQCKIVGGAFGGAMGIGIGSALLVSGLLPVFEGFFRITTDISWLELGDLNHKLLRRMQIEAPGTFHHSLIVASLAEAAAEEIGANAAMCRVGAYFHDIGKLTKPEYFIENQQDLVENPHDSLTPTMSALIIVAHVKDGVDLALKHKLNPKVIDVIQEHHGDSLVTYFYRRAQEQKREEMEKVEKGLENPEDLPKVDQKNFRYPGPRPRTKESGIISLADAVESASRTIKKPTPAKIRALVEDIVENRVCDGQLDDCLLTIRDLAVVKTVFAKTLRSVLHSRIDYPDDKSSRKGDKGDKAEKDKTAGGRKDARDPKEAPPGGAKNPGGKPGEGAKEPARQGQQDKRPTAVEFRRFAWGR